MSGRCILAVAFAATALVACETIGPLPVVGPARSSPSGAEGTWGPLRNLSEDHLLPSALLSPAQISQVTRRLVGDCDRARALRSAAREILVGYHSREAEPAVAVSISRIGNGEAQILLAVGVRNEGGRRHVSDVLTFASGGDLHGLPAYERSRDRFLREFSGRAAEDDFGDIDAVTGATAISRALTKAIRLEARALDALLGTARPHAER